MYIFELVNTKNFAFSKLGLNPIYNAYSDGSLFKYHKNILRCGSAHLGGGGVQNLG